MMSSLRSVAAVSARRHGASPLPSWAQEAIQLYESNAASQFVLYGNVYDQTADSVGTRAASER